MEAINTPSESEPGWVEPRLKDERISTGLPWKSSEQPLSNETVVQQHHSKFDSRLYHSQKEQCTRILMNWRIWKLSNPLIRNLPHSAGICHTIAFGKRNSRCFLWVFRSSLTERITADGTQLACRCTYFFNTFLPLCLLLQPLFKRLFTDHNVDG